MTIQPARTIIARNDSPDIPFDRSINPYQGCEHGCVYCYARPSHAYLDLSPGLDFETRLIAKPNAASLLRAELARAGLRLRADRARAPTPIRTSRSSASGRSRARCSRCSAECEHPFSIVTKSALVERDLDLIAPMAARGMARVYVSVTTLDKTLARTMEPRAASPSRRLHTIEALAAAGVPTGVMVAPLIPQLNDRDLEAILEASASAGARHAGWVMLRLPREVAPLFRDWLAVHHPLRAAHVMSLVQQVHGGTRLRRDLRHPPTRARRDRGARRQALRDRMQAARAQRRARPARHLALSRAPPRLAAARSLLIG